MIELYTAAAGAYAVMLQSEQPQARMNALFGYGVVKPDYCVGILGVPGYTVPAPEIKCAYCGTPRKDKSHNCRNCAGLEVV